MYIGESTQDVGETTGYPHSSSFSISDLKLSNRALNNVDNN